jgi:hypothetical protein
MSSSILYLGADSGTSRHRIQALRRLGHTVTTVDPDAFLPRHRAVEYWIHHTGARFLESRISRCVRDAIGTAEFDLALVNCGTLIGRPVVSELKRRCEAVVNYNNDDPFGSRDSRKWRLYLESLPLYDLAVVVRDCNVREARSAGARDVLRVYMSADEVAHAPREPNGEDRARWASEVVFIGTWMPERGPFLARLAELGVPLAIYGDRWSKAREWGILRRHWRGRGLYADDEYAKAVQCAGVCLGLLSKGNRDMSTTRSFEIPHLGGVLCAERTPEHLLLYREDAEAVFWSSPEECAEKCGRLLRDPKWRTQIARNGRARCIANRTLNEDVLRQVLAAAENGSSSAVYRRAVG